MTTRAPGPTGECSPPAVAFAVAVAATVAGTACCRRSLSAGCHVLSLFCRFCRFLVAGCCLPCSVRWLLVAVFAVSPLGTGARTVLVLRSRPRPRRRFRFAAHCLLLPLPSPLLFAFRPIPTGISHSHCYHARCTMHAWYTTIRGPTGKCGPPPIAVVVAVSVAVTACCRWSVPMPEPLSDLAPIAAAVAVTSTVTVTVTFSKSGCYTGSVVTGTVAITVSAALTSIYCHRRHYSCYHP